MQYDPFPYQRQLQAAFGFGGSQHRNSVASFARWLTNTFPEAAAKVRSKSPELLNADHAVSSGAISPRVGIVARPMDGGKLPAKFLQSRMMGLGDESQVYTYDIGADTSNPENASVVSEWGSKILDIIKSGMAIKQNQDLVKLNISRAEQGLPPIDASGIAPQVNVGLSPQMQSLAIWSIGGLIAVGLLSAFAKARR